MGRVTVPGSAATANGERRIHSSEGNHMAPVADTPNIGRTARIIRRLLTWRRHVVIAVASELGLAYFHLPLVPHLAAAMLLHLTIECLWMRK